MIFILRVLVQYLVNDFSILEVFVQTVHVRKWGIVPSLSANAEYDVSVATQFSWKL